MKVLVVEDEVSLGRIIKRGLVYHHCVVEVVATGKEALRCLELGRYDAVVLDLYLPDMTGETILSTLRSRGNMVPVLFLSSEQDAHIRIKLLAQCDDYVVKPCLIGELYVRLRALTRRSASITPDLLVCGPLTLDTVHYTACLDGMPIAFRNKEFALLEFFMRHEDEVLSRETLLLHVWDIHTDPFTNTVDTHIRLLRKKLGNHARAFIHTIPGRGYKFLA